MAQGEFTGTSIVGADGTARAEFKVTNGLDTWIVSQVSVEMGTAPSGATCELRKNRYLVTPIIPTGDTAAGDPPVQLRPSDLLVIEWSGCTPGDVGKIIWFYDDGKG